MLYMPRRLDILNLVLSCFSFFFQRNWAFLDLCEELDNTTFVICYVFSADLGSVFISLLRLVKLLFVMISSRIGHNVLRNGSSGFFTL